MWLYKALVNDPQVFGNSTDQFERFVYNVLVMYDAFGWQICLKIYSALLLQNKHEPFWISMFLRAWITLLCFKYSLVELECIHSDISPLLLSIYSDFFGKPKFI